MIFYRKMLRCGDVNENQMTFPFSSVWTSSEMSDEKQNAWLLYSDIPACAFPLAFYSYCLLVREKPSFTSIELQYRQRYAPKVWEER